MTPCIVWVQTNYLKRQNFTGQKTTANRVDGLTTCSDEVRLSHHCTYGSRIQRFVKYKCSRSLHQLHSASFKIRLALPPYRIGNDLTFSPSLLVSPPLYSAARYPQLL